MVNQEKTDCDCEICVRYKKIKEIIDRRNPDELISTIEELMDENYGLREDLCYVNSILNGSWPNSVEILKRSFKKAKVKKNDRS